MHKRKRKKQNPNKEDYAWVRYLDSAVVAVGLLGSISTLHQAYKIYSEQNASGVSIITFSTYLLYAVLFTIYGIAHKEKSIIILYVAQILVQGVIVVGIIIYS